MVVAYLALMPCVCEIHDEMQVVFNELTCNWVKSTVAVAWKVHHQSHLVLCELFFGGVGKCIWNM